MQRQDSASVTPEFPRNQNREGQEEIRVLQQVVQHLRQLLMKSKGPAMTLPTHQASKNIQRG